MALTKLSTDSIDLSGNTTALTMPSGTTGLDVEYLVVAGGGGGGGGANGSGGGGGAGGYLSTTVTLSLSTAYTVTVGDGGNGGTLASAGSNGNSSSISGSGLVTITATGGGAGGYDASAVATVGGSGGGGGGKSGASGGAAGTGSEGNAGGGGYDPGGVGWTGGGGGGADSSGDTGTVGVSNNSAGKGGYGMQNNIDGTNSFYAGGGGGASWYTGTSSGTGGSSIGGNGGKGTNPGTNGVTNTGSGGGGGGQDNAGGNGSSGIIILRYPNSVTATYSAGAGGAADAEVTIGNDKYIKITAGTGTVTFSGTVSSGRPSSPTEGLLRNNTTTGALEFYNGSLWQQTEGTLVRACTTSTCNYPTTATALYQFESNANDTCENYNGTNDSGITYGSPGKFGNGAQFGGGADRIDIDQALLGSGTTKIWSTSFWFLTSSTAEQYMNNTGAASAQSGFGIFISSTNGYLRYQTSSGSSFSPYLSLEDRSVQDGNWHHVVATYSSAGGTNDAYMYLYLDGVNITSLCTAKNSWQQGGGATWSSFTIPRISLGNWADSSSYPSGLYPTIGSMDQLRFFNTALTQTQVTQLYNEVAC